MHHLHPTVTKILTVIAEKYPKIAASLVNKYQDISHPQNQSFAKNPNDPHEHVPRWHQYGIITHCERFRDHLEHEVPQYLKKWGLWLATQKLLLAKVDGISKQQLLLIVALLHDIGKFTARRPGKGFKGHEADSGRLIRTTLRALLIEHGLTESQIEYIARCAELHYELGKVRREGKKKGYSFAFIKSDEFLSSIHTVQRTYPAFALEIGILFLADSLSKTEVAASGETDDELAKEHDRLHAELRNRQLDPILFTAGLQVPINIKMAEEYLRLWAKTQKKRILWLTLTETSRKKLQEKFPPTYQKHYYHHVTLAVNAPREIMQPLIGTQHQHRIEVYAHARDSRVEAVHVYTHNLPDTYGVPHITLSTQPGVEPFESVLMLEGEHEETPIDPPLELEGIIELKEI